MPVTDVHQDPDALTLTITAEFDAPVQRVWQVYADPRQLERVWGPPSHPATFIEFDLSPGGRVTYYMTGPDGEKYAGWWLVTAVEEPHGFTFDDGFADTDFNPVPTMPVSHNSYRFEEVAGRTRATFESAYESADALQQVLDMGIIEGATLAINQVDAVLAA